MEKINLYRRACENNGVIVLTDIEFLALMENSQSSTRHPEARIIKEEVWSSSEGSWGGSNGIATYLEKRPFHLEGLETYKLWQETFNNDGYARENDANRMSCEADAFNECVKALVVEPTSQGQWEFLLAEVKRKIAYASHEELVRIAMFLNVN